MNLPISNCELILENKISSSGERSWCGFIKWCKNLGVDSLSGYCTLQLGLVKEYNTQIQFGTWNVDVGLSNHEKTSLHILSLISLL